MEARCAFFFFFPASVVVTACFFFFFGFWVSGFQFPAFGFQMSVLFFRSGFQLKQSAALDHSQ